MDRDPGGQFPYAAFFWPALAAVSAGEAASSIAARFLELGADGSRTAQEPEGATPSRIALELHTVRLREFTMAKSGVPALLCAPFALHGATVADLATGHSLVAALCGAGIERLFMADWRSASADMRFLGIDDYLGDLNVLVDQVGGLVDLVGLCQGGWLSLLYAGQFPGKVRKLVMAGAPVDTAARQSELSAAAAANPMTMFQSLVSLGGGRVIGRDAAKFWGTETVHPDDIRQSLQTPLAINSPEFKQLETTFRNWNSSTIDVPGTYYLEIIEKLYKRNELVTGVRRSGTKDRSLPPAAPNLSSCGERRRSGCPEQLLAVERLVGTRPEHLRHEVAPSNHLGLFMGKRTLEEYWPRIVRWMKEPFASGEPSGGLDLHQRTG